ncbi:MAG: glycosyltransferase [Ignavibacteria bacterium]|nr:glycosyltransferase [Ignavibacteria bacterium]
MFELIFIIVIGLYFIQSLIFVIGTQKTFPKINANELPTASVIVACRNEEHNILRCLSALNELDYPEGKLEIIIVDDNSTDRTGNLIDDYIKDKTRFKKIITKKEIGKLKGKTNALANAIEIAKGEIILTTDADCAVDKNWAKTLVSYYQPDVAVVNGFTSQKFDGHFTGMQNLDFLYLLTVSSGTINLKKPLSSMGNNMSYRKSVYDEVGGYENIPFSVTEDFNLLIAINELKKYKIIYPMDSEGMVVSNPGKSIAELYHQKKRWAVGGLKAPLVGFFVVGTGFLTHLMILLTPFFFSSSAIILILFKLLIDFQLLYFVTKKLNNEKAMKYFFTFQLYYILYVVVLPIAVLLSKKVIWKGREY